jgi:hypothetical protein
MNAFFRTVLSAVAICGLGLVSTMAQTTAVIPSAEASQHVGQHVTIEGNPEIKILSTDQLVLE